MAELMDAEVTDDEVVVLAVRRRWPKKARCGKCERVAPGYDNGEGRRR